jgi:anti-anti-sigma factor
MRPLGTNESPGPNPFSAEPVPGAVPPLLIVRGEIDPLSHDAFAAAIDEALGSDTRLCLDLRDTTFMDSSGLNVLITTFHRLGQVREAIILRDPTPQVLRLLEVCGVDDLFTIRSSPSETDKADKADDTDVPETDEG